MFQMTLAFLNLKRQFSKNILIFILCATIVFFLCSYIGNIRANQEQLYSLLQVIPVSAFISNLNGSKNIGLLINGSIINQIESSGMIRDMVCTIQMPATYIPQSSVKTEAFKVIYIMGLNTLKPYPSIQPDNMEDTEAFFRGLSAQCIVSRHFLADYHLSIGDTIDLDLYRYQYGDYPGEMKYEHLAPRVLNIADSFDSQIVTTSLTMTPDIIFPIDWAKNVFEECSSPFYLDSASFYIKDPLDLNKTKAFMKKIHLLPVNTQGSDSVAGTTLVINDETFVRSATGIQNNLILLWIFSPFLIIAVLLASTVISHLVMHIRRGEFAIMHSLGMSKQDCLRIYLYESGLLAIPGGVTGVLGALVVTGVPPSAAAVAGTVFGVAYMLGAYIAVRILGRVSVLTMLFHVN